MVRPSYGEEDHHGAGEEGTVRPSYAEEDLQKEGAVYDAHDASHDDHAFCVSIPLQLVILSSDYLLLLLAGCLVLLSSLLAFYSKLPCH